MGGDFDTAPKSSAFPPYRVAKNSKRCAFNEKLFAPPLPPMLYRRPIEAPFSCGRYLIMKTKSDWAEEIIKYLQDNPVKSIEEAKVQIETIVDWIQEDCLTSVPAESIRMQ